MAWTTILVVGCILGYQATTATDDCRPNWIHFHRSCYYFVDFHSRFWDEAKNGCEESGGHLVSIESRTEFRFLVRQITSRVSSDGHVGRELWWTSGRQRPGTHEWFWDDGSNAGQGLDFDLDLWYPGEPANADGIEDYASIMHLRSRWGLNDSPHDFALKSICEYELGCDAGWHGNQGNCYKFHIDERRPWLPADYACQQEGARLVTIERYSEFSWLTQELADEYERFHGMPLRQTHLWTSGTNGLISGRWFWDDGHGTGTPFDLDPLWWYPGEPDNGNSVEFDSMIHMGLLYEDGIWGLTDEPGVEPLYFICEKYNAY